MEDTLLIHHWDILGPFEAERMANAAAGGLRLPASLKVHPMFHVSPVKAILESELVLSSTQPHPPGMSDRGPAFSVWCGASWTSVDTAWVMVLRTGRGSPTVSTCTRACSSTSTGITNGSQVGHQMSFKGGLGVVLSGPVLVQAFCV